MGWLSILHCDDGWIPLIDFYCMHVAYDGMLGLPWEQALLDSHFTHESLAKVLNIPPTKEASGDLPW